MLITVLNRLRYLIVKEMLVTLRDPKSRVILVLPPLIQIILFSYAITQEVRNASVAVLNRDTGVEGSALLKSFGHEPTFRRLFYLKKESEIDSVLDERKATAVMVIPPDFSGRLADSTSYGAVINLILDGRRPNASPILSGYIQRIVQQSMAESYRERGVNGSASPGVNVVTRHWFNPNLIPRESFLPGLICILCMVVGINLAVLSVAREREIGTFEQILVSPLTPAEILFGKAFKALFRRHVKELAVSLLHLDRNVSAIDRRDRSFYQFPVDDPAAGDPWRDSGSPPRDYAFRVRDTDRKYARLASNRHGRRSGAVVSGDRERSLFARYVRRGGLGEPQTSRRDFGPLSGRRRIYVPPEDGVERLFRRRGCRPAGREDAPVYSETRRRST